MYKNLFSRGYNKTKDRPTIILDSQQKEIVESKANNIITIAGAGSGKTLVLTERIKYLLSNGVNPCSIIAITFTNMAADEIKERLKDMDSYGIGDAFIGTIHSFANKLMKHSGQDYVIYNDSIDSEFHRELIEKYGKHITFERYLKFKDLLNDSLLGIINENEANSFLMPSEKYELKLLERGINDIKRDIDNIGYTNYPESIRSLCAERNVIDFNELLKRAKEYFNSLNTHVEHLLVDEFQDIGTLECAFIESLNADNNFFVGDDWQSIYGFKGGNVKIFLQLVQNSDFTTYYLTNNYRNGKSIINFASTVIEQVNNKINKTIDVMCDNEGEVIIKSKSKIEEVLLAIKFEKKYKDWFVLTRTNKELFKIAGLCRDAGVPYVTFKREGMSLSEVDRLLQSNRVKILTVHTSKGLESKNVVLYGKFPVICPPYLKDEEERKVMYVGITRAKDKIYILN